MHISDSVVVFWNFEYGNWDCFSDAYKYRMHHILIWFQNLYSGHFSLIIIGYCAQEDMAGGDTKKSKANASGGECFSPLYGARFPDAIYVVEG